MSRRVLSFLKFFLLLNTIFAQNDPGGNECITPLDHSGFCIPIRQCKPLLDILSNYPPPPELSQLLKKSQCGVSTVDNYPKVCCPNLNIRQSEPEDTYSTIQNNPHLPADCGADLSSRIVGGEITELSEFPWMALLEYRRGNEYTTACGGVLLNKRYVLTAAHCLRSDGSPNSWQLSAVRLGEYDTAMEHDCIWDNDESFTCADDPIVVSVEEKIPHESYNPNNHDRAYDIALLRLSKDINFTDYIKPICLPSTNQLNNNFWVAGWGMTENSSNSNIKLKLKINLANHTECAQKYQDVRINLSESQLCAGGIRGKDSCQGDSGGPLMSSERMIDGKVKWTVAGVVSVGPSHCGLKGWPGIYTKVIDYVPWILSTIRA